MSKTKEMFVVLKNGRKVRAAKFSSYEKARQFARKQIRLNHKWSDEILGVTPDGTNPTIGIFGYEIKRLHV